ncbi:MAG: CPBP family intramembrane metalloprotease [Gammaproteobacteria bacterium]|nr:CPBP family intramembrane metalloprotease [Gammaproteobacteria bacterium]
MYSIDGFNYVLSKPIFGIGKDVRELMKIFIKNHPALSLFALSFLLGGLPLSLVAAQLLPLEFSQLGALSASVAGFVLAGVEGGRERVRELLLRSLIWRVDSKWWAIALFYMVPLAAAALYFGSVVEGITFDWNTLRPIYQILPMILVLVIMAGLGEEFGWRGFLLPRLQRHHSALTSSLIIGFFHSLWHIPLFLVEGTAQNDWAQQIGLLPAFLGYSAFVIAWAIQLTWIFNNTRGSVLLVATVHGAGNAWIGGYFEISGNVGITGNNILTIFMLLLSFTIVVITGHRHLSRVAERNILAMSRAKEK